MKEEAVMEAIRALRQHMNVGQSEFADLLGVSYPSVQRYERLRPPTDHQRLIALAALSRKAGRADLEELFAQAMIEELPSQLVDYMRGRAQTRLSLRRQEIPDEFANAFQALLMLAKDSKHDVRSKAIWGAIIAILRDQKKIG